MGGLARDAGDKSGLPAPAADGCTPPHLQQARHASHVVHGLDLQVLLLLLRAPGLASSSSQQVIDLAIVHL